MKTFSLACVCGLLLGTLSPLDAQTLRYEVLPWASLRDDLMDPTGDGLEIRAWTTSLVFPLPRLMSRPRTTINHEGSFRYFNADYAGWNEDVHGPTPIDRAFVVDWAISLQHQLSRKWHFFAHTQPATDLRVEGLIAFIHAGVRVTYGFGAAVSLASVPFPVVFFNWNNGHDLSLESVLPAFLQFWYRPGGRWDVGFLARLAGNQFGASRKRFPDADAPVLQYAHPTFGPSLRLHLFPGAFVQVDVGTTIGSRFEFMDGNRTLLDLSPKERSFLRVSTQLGFAQRWWCAGVC